MELLALRCLGLIHGAMLWGHRSMKQTQSPIITVDLDDIMPFISRARLRGGFRYGERPRSEASHLQRMGSIPPEVRKPDGYSRDDDRQHAPVSRDLREGEPEYTLIAHSVCIFVLIRAQGCRRFAAFAVYLRCDFQCVEFGKPGFTLQFVLSGKCLPDEHPDENPE